MRRRASNPFTAISEDAGWLASYLSNLSKPQWRALEALEDNLKSMQRWHGKDHAELSNDYLFLAAHEDYLKAMARAIRAGLEKHPEVQKFIHTRRSIGSRETLRRARSGVEKGVRVMSKEDVCLRRDIVTLVEEYEQKHGKPLSQRQALRLLIAPQRLSKMSYQNFHELLKKLFLLHYFPRPY